MAFDLKLTFSSLSLNRPLSAGSIISQEGLILVHRLEDGIEKAHLATSVGGSDIPIGWAKTADSLPDITSEVENLVVPTAPATLEVDLRNTNLVSSRMRAVSSNGTVLTIDETFAGSPADDAVKIDIATGRTKYHPDEAGSTVTWTYLYNLTLVQAKQRFGERHVNNRGLHAEHGFIEIGSGSSSELYTDQFHANLDWSAGTAITLGDAGQLTQGGSGPTIKAIVISAPSEQNPFLGIRANFAA